MIRIVTLSSETVLYEVGTPPKGSSRRGSCQAWNQVGECDQDRSRLTAAESVAKRSEVLPKPDIIQAASVWIGKGLLHPSRANYLRHSLQPGSARPTFLCEGKAFDWSYCLLGSALSELGFVRKITRCQRSRTARQCGRKRRFPRWRCRPGGCRRGYRR